MCGIVLEASKLQMHLRDQAFTEKCLNGFLKKGFIFYWPTKYLNKSHKMKLGLLSASICT